MIRWKAGFTNSKVFLEYATYQMNSQLFVQKYQLYLPAIDELRNELENTLREAEEENHEG